MKFITKKPPIVTNGEHTYKRSLTLHIALIIAALAAIILNGFYTYPVFEDVTPLFNSGLEQSFKVFSMIAIASMIAVVIELFYSLFEGDTTKFSSYKGFVDPINTGILIALLLPINTPIFVLALAVFVGVYIGKLVFGGFGFYIFNPALVGALFAFSAFGADHLAQDLVTPLELLKTAITTNSAFIMSDVWPLLIGNYQSISIGSTSVIVLLLLFAYLCVTKVIDLRISGTYLLTVVVMSFGIGGILFGFGEMALNYVLINLITGIAVFGAVFFVSETVSTPTSRETKLVYAVTVAILMMVFRTLSSNVEGLIYAVLFGNMITPFLNRTVKKSNKKALIKTLIGITIAVVGVTFIIGFMLKGQIEESTVSAIMFGGIL